MRASANASFRSDSLCPKAGAAITLASLTTSPACAITRAKTPRYDRRGWASWYGELFHGRRTANGEIYDMDRLSAAHPTLPLPVYAQVTNLKNGRTIVVRINDRGPFANDRIIDLSRRSAEALGFRRQGTAPVRVRYLQRAPLSGDDSYEQHFLMSQGLQRYASKPPAKGGKNVPTAVASLSGKGHPPLPDRAERPVAAAPPPVLQAAAPVEAAPLGWPAALEGSPESTGSTGPPAISRPQPIASVNGLSIQAGSFKNKDNAERARAALAGIAPVEVAEIDMGGEIFYRVRVGPFADKAAAVAALPRVTEAGYQGARIILRN